MRRYFLLSCACAAAAITLFTATVQATSSPAMVTVKVLDSHTRQVQVQIVDQLSTPVQLIVRRDHGMYDDDSHLTIHGEEERHKLSTSNAFSMPAIDNSWAALTIPPPNKQGQYQVRGVMSINGVIYHLAPQHKNSYEHVATTIPKKNRRRMTTDYSPQDDFSDEVLEVPGSITTSTITTVSSPPKSTNLRGGPGRKPSPQSHPTTTPHPTPQHAEYEVTAAGQDFTTSGTPMPFYPSCYPGDTAGATVRISIAIDWGYQVAVHGGDISQQGLVMDEMEQIVAVARVIYLAQLNVQIQVQDVVFGRSNSAAPLNGIPGTSTCSSAIYDTLTTFSTLVQTQKPAAHWHLLTACFAPPGAIGIAFRNTLCDPNYGTAVSSRSGTGGSWTWLTFSHELGHAHGSSHSFENGVGTTGGIMDYGNGKVGNTVEFHPYKRPEVCLGLTQGLSLKCPYLTIASVAPPGGSTCGNGLLEPNEDCECLTSGSKSCGGGLCVNCKTTRKITCSSALFVLRNPATAPYVVADESLLSAPECCTANGVLAPPKTTCNNGLDVCSAYGSCERVCSAYALPGCGFDNSGCLQSCLSGKLCSNTIKTLGPPPLSISMVQDGTACYLNDHGTLGTCTAGVCGSSSSTHGDANSSAPTRTPTSFPTPPPVRDGGNYPPCPSEEAFIKCPAAKSKGQCVSPCKWCGNKCLASPLGCMSTTPMSVIFAHCPPFVTTPPPDSPGPPTISGTGPNAQMDCPDPKALSWCSGLGRKACLKSSAACTYCGGQGTCVPGKSTTSLCDATLLAQIMAQCPH